MEWSQVSLLIGILVFGAEDKKKGPPEPQAAGQSSAPKSKPNAGPRNPGGRGPLLEAREGFATKIIDRGAGDWPVPEPQAGELTLTKYKSPVGELVAYLSPDPRDGKKRPAIIWIRGGDPNSIGSVWGPREKKNDQSASAFRKARIIMMYPALRGGNGGAGRHEGFYGEVDDVIAAADHLAAQPFVDPGRIYLGGHSTGGTMVLLVAAASDRFRGVFSFGPAAKVSGYPLEFLPFDTSISKEVELRSPLYWINSVLCPTFVFEGTDGNISSFNALKTASQNTHVKLYAIKDGNHFNILHGLTRLIARKINADTGKTSRISFTPDEIRRSAREYSAK